MGHRRFVSSLASGDERTDGERAFAIALGQRNERLIQESPDRVRLEELRMWVSNLTKGACRVADYAFDDEETRFLMCRKADTLANLTVAGFISKSPVHRTSDQGAAWAAYRRAKAFHLAHLDRVKEFESKGGYSSKQFYIEYESVGAFAEKLFKSAALLDPDRRRHAFALAESLFRLTQGEDPLGY